MTAVPCKNHPDAAASWMCENCGEHFCEQCINIQAVGAITLTTCKGCGERCVPVSAKGKPVEIKKQEGPATSRNFYGEVPLAFAYPFRGSGIALLLVGSAFLWALGIVSKIGIAWPVAIILMGYLCACLMRILNSTANGEGELPGWPDFSDFYMDIIHPYGLFLSVTFFSSLPAVGYVIVAFVRHPGGTMEALMAMESIVTGIAASPVFWGLVVLGLLYWPMGLIAVAVYDSAEGLNPARIFPAIAKTHVAYLLACIVVGVIVALRSLSETLFGLIPFVGSFVGAFLSFYLVVVEMRILGLLYYAYEDRLAWFENL